MQNRHAIEMPRNLQLVRKSDDPAEVFVIGSKRHGPHAQKSSSFKKVKHRRTFDVCLDRRGK